MIRIYLDWNIISKLKTPEFKEIFEFFTKNSNCFSIPFSPAHFEDISKSDFPGNEKLIEDITNMEVLCHTNHLSYDKEQDIAAPYIATPEQYFSQHRRSDSTFSAFTNPENIKSLFKDIENTPAGIYLETPIQLPKLVSPISEPTLNTLLEDLQKVTTIKELIIETTNIFHKLITDKNVYNAIRETISQYKITETITPVSDVIPTINQILKRMGTNIGFMDFVKLINNQQKEKSNQSLFIIAYLILDMLYKPDKLPKKGNNATNIITDAMHAYYGAFCDYFITDDKKLAEKASVLYQEFNIDVPIISSKELIDTLSNTIMQSQGAIGYIANEIINAYNSPKNNYLEKGENEDCKHFSVQLSKYCYNFFNKANVSIWKHSKKGTIVIQLFRRFKGLSHYVFYTEVEQVLNILSQCYGNIPEIQREAIKHCSKNASYVWQSNDQTISIIIREDDTYEGRPELDFIIDMTNISTDINSSQEHPLIKLANLCDQL